MSNGNLADSWRDAACEQRERLEVARALIQRAYEFYENQERLSGELLDCMKREASKTTEID
jgi:hypothetical protein